MKKSKMELYSDGTIVFKPGSEHYRKVFLKLLEENCDICTYDLGFEKITDCGELNCCKRCWAQAYTVIDEEYEK